MAKKPSPRKKVDEEVTQDPILGNDDESAEFALPDFEESFEQEAAVLAAEAKKTAKASTDDSGKASDGTEEEKPEDEFSKEELAEVFDQILFEGNYTEKQVIRNKLSFEFISRSAGDAADIARFIDKAGFKLLSTMEQHISMLNLAYSLISYQGEDLSDLPVVGKKAEDRSRYGFLKTLPGGVVSAMLNRLSKFDRKVYFAMMEGVENF